MKTILLVPLIAVACCLAPTANAAGNGFISARVGITQWPSVDNGSKHSPSYGLEGGYRWQIGGHNSLGFEVGYADLGSQDSAHPMDFISGTVRETAIILGASYRLDFADRWFFEAGLGAMHARSKDKVSVQPGGGYDYKFADNLSGNGRYFHAGIGYAFSPAFGLSLNFGSYHASFDSSGYSFDRDLTSWSLGFNFRF